MGTITLGVGTRSDTKCELASFDSLEQLKAILESRTGQDAWWSCAVFKPDPNRAGELHRASGRWFFSSTVAIDVDCHDGALGKSNHIPISTEQISKASTVLSALGPSLFHATPRGMRVVFVLAEPVENSRRWQSIAGECAARVERALRDAGLFSKPKSGTPGLDVDAVVTRDLARILFCPRAMVNGIQRIGTVTIAGPIFQAAELSPSSVVEPPPVVESKPIIRSTTAFDRFDEARSKYLAANPADFPTRVGRCPLCKHDKCFHATPDKPDKWKCFSENHEGPTTGDKLDIDAALAGRTPAEHLRATGYLSSTVVGTIDVDDLEPPVFDPSYEPESNEDRLSSMVFEMRELTAAYVSPADADANEWPDPEPIFGVGQDLPRFDPHLFFPRVLAEWVDDVALGMGVRPEVVGAPALVALAAAIGREVAIRPRARGNWTVVPNLWGCVIGSPSVKKSPATDAAFAPLRAVEKEASIEHAKEMRRFAVEEMLLKSKRDVLKKQLDDAVEAGNVESIESIQHQIEELHVDEPLSRRILVNDFTIDKLSAMLDRSKRGLTVATDELALWLAMMGQKGNERMRPFFLAAWNGTGSYAVDRLGRGSIPVETCTLSLWGTTQPDVFCGYIQKAREGGDDGLAYRFQVAVYATGIKGIPPDVAPNDRAHDRVRSLFRTLATATAAEWGATLPSDSKIPFFRFDAAAQEVFGNWYVAIRERAADERNETIFQQLLSKYDSLMPSIALLFHCVDLATGNARAGSPVSEECALRAVLWCQYLEAHARHIYSLAGRFTARVSEAARTLARRLPELGAEPFTVRDVARRAWSGMASPTVIKSTLEELERFGWVRSATVRVRGKRGRPTVHFEANPKAFEVIERARARIVEWPRAGEETSDAPLTGEDFRQ